MLSSNIFFGIYFLYLLEEIYENRLTNYFVANTCFLIQDLVLPLFHSEELKNSFPSKKNILFVCPLSCYLSGVSKLSRAFHSK